MAVEPVMQLRYNNVSERRQAVAAFSTAYMGYRIIVKSYRTFAAVLATVLIIILWSVPAILVSASDTPNPSTVTIVGNLQSELGCSGDWQPDCSNTYLTYDGEDDVWQGVFSVPTGSWEYKVALNNLWDENYGLDATLNGPNIPLVLEAATSVKFYYDHETHWVTDNVNSVIATVAGSFQSEIGCDNDWDPGCLRSWLQDPDGDGLHSFAASIPAGSYECKVAINEGWNENYGEGGVQNGSNILFVVDTDGLVLFQYDSTSHILTVDIEAQQSSCFIATAAYSTPMAQEIQILRAFKDEYLLTNPLGQAFVDFYYRVSPPIAELLSEHPSLKPLVRTALVPAVAMSAVVTNTTVVEKIAILGLLAFVSIVFISRRKKEWQESSDSVDGKVSYGD
jgi:hypothetical protein